MDNEILRKILKYNNKSLPDGCKHPLLLPEIARDVSASIVKILTLTSGNSNTTNTKLRLSILEYTRKLCTADAKMTCFDSNDEIMKPILAYLNKRPSKTGKIYDENHFSEEINNLLVAEIYIAKFANRTQIDEDLSQEIAVGHAMLNLEPGNLYLQNITIKLLNSNNEGYEIMSFFRRIWRSDDINDAYICDKLLKKLLPDVEIALLNKCKSLITSIEDINANDCLTDELLVIAKRCSLSTEVFLSCFEILNYIFINSNYNGKVNEFVHFLLSKIKELRCDRSIVHFYPGYLQNLAFYLDLESDLVLTDSSGEEIKNIVFDISRNFCKSNFPHFVMLLSHFPGWLDCIGAELLIKECH